MGHIFLCEWNSKIFIAGTSSSHPWLWPAYAKSRFAFTRAIEIKGLCLQLKKSGTEYAVKKINFLTLAAANGRSLPLRKVSLGSDELLMSYYQFIFHPINMSSTWFWLIFGHDPCWLLSHRFQFHRVTWRELKRIVTSKARVTPCDLSGWFFYIHKSSLCEFQSNEIRVNKSE